MRRRKSLRDALPRAELISQALTVQLRTEYDVTQPYPATIDTLLQRLVCQKIGRETAQERDQIWEVGTVQRVMLDKVSGKWLTQSFRSAVFLGWARTIIRCPGRT